MMDEYLDFLLTDKATNAQVWAADECITTRYHTTTEDGILMEIRAKVLGSHSKGYHVKIYQDKCQCTCPAFRYGGHGGGICKHIVCLIHYHYSLFPQTIISSTDT